MAENKYVCIYCGKAYPDPVKKDNCLASHDLIYVPMPRGDLNRLLNFIMSKNEEYLTESLVKNLFKYVHH
jgi:hypothetical protein